ncbi:unnamed protein product, partial [Ectocarpus sp. 6 AP-2014]
VHLFRFALPSLSVSSATPAAATKQHQPTRTSIPSSPRLPLSPSRPRTMKSSLVLLPLHRRRRRLPPPWLLLLLGLASLAGPAAAKVAPNGAMVWDGNGWIALWDDDEAPRPPPPKTSSWKHSDTSVFVGVSSFRDKRCPQTLVNFFSKAKYPERVTVGVVQQNDHEDVDCVVEYCKMMGGHAEGPLCPYFDNIKTLRVEARWAAGPCYGRHLQSYMLRDEEFCMQTDSHMDVVQDWDAKLMAMWGRVNNEYGILTTYVHKIEQLREGYENKKEVPHLCQLGFTETGNHPRYVQAKLATKLPSPKLTNTWAAGLSLAKCHAWKASPYDPGLRKVFDGEEFSMHARLWTRGYDTYTPDKSLVGHDYNKVKEGPQPSSWLNNKMVAGAKDLAYKRMFTLFGMPGKVDTEEMWESIGQYGLGTKRTLEQYQEFIGVNLTTLEIMGSRCGTLRYVPFEETWPPTENNLAGPYWERRRAGRGIHAPGYAPALSGPSKYVRAGGSSRAGRPGLGWGAAFLKKFKLFCAFAFTFAAIGACALGFASCFAGEDGGAGARRRKGAGGGSRKPRGRHQWARRAGILGARSEE